MSNRFITLVRKEFWNTRSFWLMPLFALTLVGLGLIWNSLATGEIAPSNLQIENDSGQLVELSRETSIKNVRMMITFTALAAVELSLLLYLVNALSGDRRDRTLLFWKSLPVSDASLVLSVLLPAMAIIPFIGFLSAVLVDLAIIVFAYPGDSTQVLSFWNSLFAITIGDILWLFPVMGWMLFVSSWVPRFAALVGFLAPWVMALLMDPLIPSIPHWIAQRLPVVGRLPDAMNGVLKEQWDTFTGQPDAQWALVWDTILQQASGEGVATLFSHTNLWVGMAVGVLFIWLAVIGLRWQAEKL